MSAHYSDLGQPKGARFAAEESTAVTWERLGDKIVLKINHYPNGGEGLVMSPEVAKEFCLDGIALAQEIEKC